MPYTSRAFWLVLLLPVVGLFPVHGLAAEPSPLALPPALPPALLETSPLGEEVEVLRPERPRSEKLTDRLHAAALFAHGRMLQQRDDFAGAIQRYQRAWRYHPEQVSILDSIVAIAFELKRNGEAARYAVISAERNPRDRDLLRRLAMFLTQQEDFERAAALYEKALDLPDQDDDEAHRLLVALDLGRLYLVMEEYQKSAAAFTKPADALASPEQAGLSSELQKELLGMPEQTYRMFGESFVRAGMYERAETAFRKAHEVDPNETLLEFSLARVAAGRDQRAEALQHLNRYFDASGSIGGLEPYDLFAELIAKETANEADARQKVLARLRPLWESDPANAALGIAVANQLQKAGQYDAAAEVYDDLLKVSPSLEAFSGLIELERERRQVPQLLDALGKAVARAGDFEPLEESTAAILDDKQLLADLLQEAQQRLKQHPEKLKEGVALAAGLLAIAGEAYGEVEPFMALALENGVPTTGAIISQWGLGLLMADQHEAAAKVFQSAIDGNVNEESNAAYYFYLASALSLADRLDEAVAAARKAAELRPTARFKSRIPSLYYYAKKYDKAVELYEKLLAEYGNEYGDSATRDVVRETRLVLSAIAVQQDRIDQAIEYLEQVLDEFPEDIGAHNDLGYLWADENVHLQRALAMTRTAVAAEGDNHAYRDSLGWALFRLGRLEEAIAELEIAASEDNPDGVILDHLADAYWEAGRHEEALQHWQRAIEAFEKSGESDMAAEVRPKAERKP